MIEIQEDTIIKSGPEKIWNFLTELHINGNYKKWHPKDHITHYLIKGDMKRVGSQAYFREHVGDRVLKTKYTLIQSVYPTYLEYEPTFPLSLLNMVRVYFKIEPTAHHESKLTAYVGYGFRMPFFGRLLDWIVPKFFPTESVKKHMYEEGINIKRIIENDTA